MMSLDFRTRQAGALFAENLQAQSAPGRDRREGLRQRILAEPLQQRLMRACADLFFCVRPRQWRTLREAIAAILGAHKGQIPARRMNASGGDCSDFAGLAMNIAPAVVADGYGRGLTLAFMLGRPCWFAPERQACVAPSQFLEPQAALDLLASQRFTFTFDQNFEHVLATCIAKAVGARAPFQPGRDGMRIFAGLFDEGFAHSLEIRDRAGVLTGGLFGIAHNKGFFTLGTFGSAAHVADLALTVMNRHLAQWGFGAHVLPGLQARTPANADFSHLGFSPLFRHECAAMAAGRSSIGRIVCWSIDPELARQPQAGPAGVRIAA